MRKFTILIMLLLAGSFVASLAFAQVNPVAAQQESPVGVVVAYVPGQSITIADQSGALHEYMISSSLKILPPGRANALGVGSFVTIIAPASLSQGKQMAVGIVVHPNVPGGWIIPTISATPLATGTTVETQTPTPVGTLPGTQTATGTASATATGTVLATETETSTATPTVVGTITETATATPTPAGGGTAPSANALIDWLASLFRQILSSR
jgi:hypothetical protein